MIKVTPHCIGVKVQTILSSSMFNVKTNTVSDREFLPTGANIHARTANAQTSSVSTSVRVSSAAANSYLCQVLFRLFFDFMLVHLQKVLFTADEAHRASHPSEARAHTYWSKPIQKLPPPLGSPRARSSSSAAQIWWLNSAHMGDKCAVWHRHDVRPTRRRSLRFGAYPKLACGHTAVRCLSPAEEPQVTLRSEK